MCQDAEVINGIEKIAIYADAFGDFTHAARQLRDGRWTSKLGDLDDIEHESLEEVAGAPDCDYGVVVRYMMRPIS